MKRPSKRFGFVDWRWPIDAVLTAGDGIIKLAGAVNAVEGFSADRCLGENQMLGDR
ncbi:hypothetical protein [Mesorhizobium tamadayense]|uniref:hypothetical protein n=1 Tax=Mesorhizobium tamadayense TaxID=425306 RepID=UPI00142E4F75|nr:hypothetical protein [Mesorhizobium tamadayense]